MIRSCRLFVRLLILGSAGCCCQQHSVVQCAPDSVRVGPTCVDKYEASVWQLPAAALTSTSAQNLITKIQDGTVTLADLTAGGATQLKPAGTCGELPDTGIPPTGNWTPVPGTNPPTPGVYAVSIAGAVPSACVSWFQAEQLCALSGKRLLSNQEWQRAAAGTPDPGTGDDGATTCKTSGAGNPVPSGTRAGCVSAWGAFDMVGNVWEWVADWTEQPGACTTYNSTFGNDMTCIGANTVASIPTGFLRGGSMAMGTQAGVFALDPGPVTDGDEFFGFRCGR